MNVYFLEIGSGSLFQGIAQIAADRIAERHVRRDAFPEESRNAMTRAVEKLIRKDYVHRLKFFAKAADSASRDYAFDAEQLHRVDVCAVWKLCWQKAMAS